MGGYTTSFRGGYNFTTHTRYIHKTWWPCEPAELARTYFDICRSKAADKAGLTKSLKVVPAPKPWPRSPGPPVFWLPGTPDPVRTDVVCCYPSIYTAITADTHFRFPAWSFGLVTWWRRHEWCTEPGLKSARCTLWGLMEPPLDPHRVSRWQLTRAPHLVAATMTVLHAVARDAKAHGARAWYANDSILVGEHDFAGLAQALDEHWGIALHEPVPAAPMPDFRPRIYEESNLLPLTKDELTRIHASWVWSKEMMASAS
jgi:hypothetical protein